MGFSAEEIRDNSTLLSSIMHIHLCDKNITNIHVCAAVLSISIFAQQQYPQPPLLNSIIHTAVFNSILNTHINIKVSATSMFVHLLLPKLSSPIERITKCSKSAGHYYDCLDNITTSGGRGSSAVERATPGEEVPGSIPAVAARSLQVGSVSV